MKMFPKFLCFEIVWSCTGQAWEMIIKLDTSAKITARRRIVLKCFLLKNSLQQQMICLR